MSQYRHPDYSKLPEAVKMAVSEKEYCWLTDTEKRRLVDDFCMPEPETD